jgi:Tfp pilus assembly protein PilN
MSFFKSNINLGSDTGFLAVETEFFSDQEFVLRILEIKQKKSEMDFNIIFNDKVDAEQLTKLIKGKSIILLVTGKGVLTKKINKSEDVQAEDVLPNSGKEDFYWQNYPCMHHSFATICRKQKLDELLNLMKQNNVVIGEIYLGLGVCHLAGSLLEREVIQLSKQELHFSNGILQEIKPTSNEELNYSIGKKEISSSMISLLCAGVSFASKSELQSSIDSEEFIYFKNEWKQKTLFQKAGAIVLVSFLLILFGNYLAYNHYSQRYELLQEEVAYKQSEIDLLNTLNEELKEKQSLIGGTGMNNGYKVSVLADKIGITIPSTVQLLEMNIQPLEKGKLKKDDKAAFETDRIILKGKIFKSTDINQWIKNMKDEKIVKDVVVSQYNQSLNENYAEFELTLNLN